MHAASRARRLCRILKPPVHLGSPGFIPSDDYRVVECAQICAQACRNHSSSFSSAAHSLGFAGPDLGNRLLAAPYSIISSSPYSSEASAEKEEPTETVKEMHDKILESVNTKRTMAPNAWTWLMIENCNNREDIKLLFDVLQNLRRFRLSNLRIHENFNCNLCREVTKACVRARALDFDSFSSYQFEPILVIKFLIVFKQNKSSQTAVPYCCSCEEIAAINCHCKKALWKHNVYGLTPTIGSANHVMQYAKEHKDATLMQEVMRLLKKNNLPLQPSTADIVFSICYDTENWGLLTKYSKRFVKDGMKLHRAAFDIWMDFAAKVGDVESLWKIETLRSESVKQHTVGSGFSCAKGLLLEGKPEEAATVIQVLNQSLPDAKRSSIMAELQKLVSEWPFEVIKRKKEDERKALATTLKSDIPAMVSFLLNTGLEVKVNMEGLTTEGALC